MFRDCFFDRQLGAGFDFDWNFPQIEDKKENGVIGKDIPINTDENNHLSVPVVDSIRDSSNIAEMDPGTGDIDEGIPSENPIFSEIIVPIFKCEDNYARMSIHKVGINTTFALPVHKKEPIMKVPKTKCSVIFKPTEL